MLPMCFLSESARETSGKRLSGGMARRVALARAIALDPMLTMYDEPFAGLDPISLNVIALLIRRLNDALAVTSIVVTYDVTESLKVVDYAYLINDGLVAAEGTPADLLISKELAAAADVPALTPSEVAQVADLYAHDFYLDPMDRYEKVA